MAPNDWYSLGAALFYFLIFLLFSLDIPPNWWYYNNNKRGKAQEENKMKITDGKKTVEIKIQRWNGSGYDPDWNRR